MLRKDRTSFASRLGTDITAKNAVVSPSCAGDLYIKLMSFLEREIPIGDAEGYQDRTSTSTHKTSKVRAPK